MFARDDGPDSQQELNTKNYYGVHPFYLCVEEGGKAHGVVFINSNAQVCLRHKAVSLYTNNSS